MKFRFLSITLIEKTQIFGLTMCINDNLPLHIKKGHELVFAQQDLTCREADLFALMIAHMQNSDWDDVTVDEPSPAYNFSSAQLKKWLNLESNNISAQIDSVAERLSTRKISVRIVDSKGEIKSDYVPLMRRCTYKDRQLTMKPNSELKIQYIEYRKGFALINTKTYLSIKHEYSKRIYEMISRFKDRAHGSLPIFDIDTLKGYLGLLNEKGKIKDNKKTFHSTSKFVTRCIKDSIQLLQEDPEFKKQAVFLKTEDGLGYKLHKKGRAITKIELAYTWIDKKMPFEKLLTAEAIQNIKLLENKRLVQRQELNIKELELLAHSYRSLEQDDRAQVVENALIEKYKQQNEQEQQQEADLSFLGKLDELAKLNGDTGY